MGSKLVVNVVLSLIFISSFIKNGPIQTTFAWDNAEFEMFDLVEEVGQNFYEVIGVAPDASAKEIKQAYRKLSVKLHPDKNPAPDAAEKFRQLVGIYEVLKDDNLRKAYEDVLVNGLPNWRQPIFYFRRARKLAIWQVTIILLGIISVGQYLAGWASYFEQRLSLREGIETKLRQKQRTRKAQKDGATVAELEAELDQYLKKPSILDIAPIQICRGVKYLVCNFPSDAIAYIQAMKAKQEEEARERLREQEILEEQKRLAEEPKKPRKRKTFAVPEKEESDEETAADSAAKAPVKPTRPTYVSGGLWTDEDLTELSKLCAKYPGGTPDRWEKISDALRRPVPEITFMAKKIKDGLTKRQEEEEELKPQVKVKVKTKGGKADAIAAGDPAAENVANWSAEEQKCLEKALLVYPKGALDRWDKIAMMVPSRTKEECMRRFKYVAEMVKKKKEKPDGSDNSAVESQREDAEPPSNNAPSADIPGSKSDSLPEPDSSSGPDPEKDAVHRKDSSSSNKSSSDGDWCLVESSG